MGSAAVSISAAPDGLLVTVAELRAVAIPEGLREGQVVPFELPAGQGFVVLPFQGSILLVWVVRRAAPARGPGGAQGCGDYRAGTVRRAAVLDLPADSGSADRVDRPAFRPGGRTT